MRSLYEALEAYTRKGLYPFHMPGHKGNPEFLPPVSLMALDVTELKETDNLNAPTGCIAETERRIATIYGADQSFLLVNGSTAGVVAAICAVCGDGDLLAVARNCHRSVFSGMVQSGARPVYFLPGELPYFPGAKAVIVTSPSYEGIVLDIEAVAKTVHSWGGILIVDEAHGAHFPFHEVFPQGALGQGADVVVHSFHKTLPAFSQSAAVHVNGGRVDIRRLRQSLSFVQTSSPSYLIMAATDYMLNTLQANAKYFERYVENLQDLRKAIEGSMIAQPPGSDISKLNLAVPGGQSWARENGLALELVSPARQLAMTSVADTPEGFCRLANAVKKVKAPLFEHLSPKELNGLCVPFSETGFGFPEVVIPPREAVKGKVRKAKLSESIGEISGGFITPFPPGIPLLSPGECITRSLLEAVGDCDVEVLV